MITTLACLILNTSYSQKENAEKITTLEIKPSLTDKSILNVDAAHIVSYALDGPKKKLLLFLPGTRGIPKNGPKLLFKAAMEEGLQVINLSYINTPAVAAICRGENLENDTECARKFREKRIFGTNTTDLIEDEAQDAIVNRLYKLLIYLQENDPKGSWGKYLKDGEIQWKEIIVSGQSQGGGMAAFIAKKHVVARIISFSGGWDYKSKGIIADWYTDSSATKLKNWYGTYHVLEPKADAVAKTLEAMKVPKENRYGLDLPVQANRKAHGQAIRNVAYKELWRKLFKID